MKEYKLPENAYTKEIDGKIAVLIPDLKIGGFTAYFSIFPEVIGDGDTEEEALENLLGAYQYMIDEL